MSQGISDLDVLISTMGPVLHPGVYVYCVVPPGTPVAALSPVATVAEPEGLTLVLPEEQALRAGLNVVFRSAWITLTVHSDLQAVGLTAAFAGALGRAGISCNVIAGTYHDHIFVPVDLAQAAMTALQGLQRGAVHPPAQQD